MGHTKTKEFTRNERSATRQKHTSTKASKTKKHPLLKTIEKHRLNIIKHIKLANRFERQKLGRRQTEQKNDPDKLAKVEAEIDACKSVNADELADRHLRKTFAKIRAVRECKELPAQWGTGVVEEHMDEAMMNVSARLYNHQSVRMAMTKCITDVRTVISVEEARKINDQADQLATSTTDLERLNSKRQTELKQEDVVVNQEASVGATDSEGETSDDSDHEFDSGSEVSLSDAETGETYQSRKRKVESETPSENEEQLLSDSELNQPRRKKSKRLPAQPASSEFFPSLTAVGYAVNSDSEASDLDEEVAPRKNRRGQKARQAIWEKKYKEKAKHLQKQAEKQAKRDAKNRKRGRDDGWDARKGAVSNERPGYRNNSRETGANTQPVLSRGEGSRIANEREAAKAGPLHPSWEAKKLLKAKEKIGINSYAGSKITF